MHIFKILLSSPATCSLADELGSHVAKGLGQYFSIEMNPETLII
jgi:hypothetical protein